MHVFASRFQSSMLHPTAFRYSLQKMRQATNHTWVALMTGGEEIVNRAHCRILGITRSTAQIGRKSLAEWRWVAGAYGEHLSDSNSLLTPERQHMMKILTAKRTLQVGIPNPFLLDPVVPLQTHTADWTSHAGMSKVGNIQLTLLLACCMLKWSTTRT